jgi:hypothetical protein
LVLRLSPITSKELREGIKKRKLHSPLFGQIFIELSEERLYCGYCSSATPLFENGFSMKLVVDTPT